MRCRKSISGLAKREEELYLPARPLPLALPRSDPGLKLLQQLRDEGHRFAVSRYRRRRSKRLLTSRLDELPGLDLRRTGRPARGRVSLRLQSR